MPGLVINQCTRYGITPYPKLLRGRARHTIIHDFSAYFFLVKLVFLQQYCFQYSRNLALRKTSFPNQTCDILEESLHWSQYFWAAVQVDHEKVRLVGFESRLSCACILVILLVKLRCVARSLRSVRGWYRLEWDWLALSPKFIVKWHRSVARELVRFSSWRSVMCSVRLWGVCRVEECVEMICQYS